MALVYILLIIIIFLLGVLIYLLAKVISKGSIEKALEKAWKESELSRQIERLFEQTGKIEVYAEKISEDYRSLEQMLRVPKERACLGEMTLEQILSEQLPPEMFGIRTQVLDGKKPDAYIKSTAGIICIDSKFPLDNYKKMREAEERGEKVQAEELKNKFLEDVESHLNKIVRDYISPHNGSADFAFAYIPSESVYYFLITEAYELLRQYAIKGVQVVSPLTLTQKVALIKAGVHAQRLSEQAEAVKKDIDRLSTQLDKLNKTWNTLHNHLRNAYNKAQELEAEFQKIQDQFRQAARFS